MSPRKLVDKELSKEQILEVARRLFITKGYSGVSMRDIAKELGYSHGAIYYHFQNKEALFHELLSRGFELLNDSMAQITQTTHELGDILRGFIQFGFTHPHHYEIMFMTREESFLTHAAPVQSYNRFTEEVSKFEVSTSDAYFIFMSLHGFISYHLRCEAFFKRGIELSEAHVQFLMGCLQ